MSSSTEVDIVNIALVSVGEPKITALTDSSARAVAANQLYEPERDGLLEDHLWNFATRRIVLRQPDEKVITDINTPSATVTITSTSHGFADGDTVAFTGIVGPTDLNAGRYEITNTAANTFDLVATDGSGFAAYDSGGTIRKLPAWGPNYEFALPADFFRIARTEQFEDQWKIEDNLIVSDNETINIKYVVKVTADAGVATMSEGYKQALSARLAYKLTYTLSGKQSYRADLKSEYKEILAKVMLTDTQQESVTTVGGSRYVNGRLREPMVGVPGGWANSV